MAGSAALQMRRLTGGSHEPAWGGTPAIPAARAQGIIPTLKMPTARGWVAGQTPVAARGLKVNAFAAGLKHPRWMHVLPNGDVLAAESSTVPSANMRSLFDYAMVSTMRRAGALGVSANRITRLRDADGDGVAEIQEVFLEGLNQPFGMALLGDTFYVGNTDGVVAFPYEAGARRITAPGRTLASFKPGGHWTRSLLPSPDGRKLYVGVGSSSNIAENGMDAEEGRALIHELDLASGAGRTFASGLRNPVGMAWQPQTGMLWTVVNERDGLGDETPPDYLTSVRDGGFYGWPYCYWGQTVDERVLRDPAMVAKAITPD
ncbi:MAG TPA: PQQ-dependent sugar dehydrogenase, partial [Acetobacteraceae bacterium]